MKKLSTLFLFLTFFLKLSAQEFELPRAFAINKAEDCARYNDDIIKCVDWMIATPLSQDLDKRQDAAQFFIQWISSSPDVSVEVNGKIITFMDSNPDLIIIFMGGWAKYVLVSKDTDKEMGNLSGIESVIEFYQKNIGSLKRDKNVEKFIKMKAAGTLIEYIRKNV